MDWRRLFARAPADAAANPPQAEDPSERARDVVLAYHQRTKHGEHRFALGPMDLDWATQPDPFRRWKGAELVPLAHPEPSSVPRYEQVFVEGTLPVQPLDAEFVARLFHDSLALSAWKRAGESRWSLRVNPSSGNLHPTEGYLLAPAIAGVSTTPFLAHYAPREHALELRAHVAAADWDELVRDLPRPCVLVGLASIHWREAWKYGERAYRYCNHDVGHAIACVTLAAAAMGWKATMLDGASARDIEDLLGLRDTRAPEAEEPDCVLVLHSHGTSCGATTIDARALARIARIPRLGIPNDLSPDHVEWEVIDVVANAARRPPNVPARPVSDPTGTTLVPGDERISFRDIVRRRRSAVAMDGRSGMRADAFFQTLRRTLSVRGETAFSALPWSPRVHLALFVHRVEDVDPGLYVLVRDPADESALRAAMRTEFEWSRLANAPTELPLFRLHRGDVRSLAARVSCGQQIAADGCFSLGMIARFETSIREDGAWMYPRLFWETGVIGQLLYLEAEALGLRATGIGCFFDDSVHGVFGLRGHAWQSLYHFTIGGPVDDPRISAEPAYAERIASVEPTSIDS